MVQILDQKRDLSGTTTMRQSPPVLGILREFWRHLEDGRWCVGSLERHCREKFEL